MSFSFTIFILFEQILKIYKTDFVEKKDDIKKDITGIEILKVFIHKNNFMILTDCDL